MKNHRKREKYYGKKKEKLHYSLCSSGSLHSRSNGQRCTGDVCRSDNCFSPDESCTRAQIVTFLKRYEERPADAKMLSGTELDNLKATIINAFENVETKIDVSSFRVDSKQFREILDSLYDSRADENQYYIASISTGVEKDGTPAWIQVHYQYSAAEVKERREKDTKFNSLVKEIVKDNVTSGMSDFDKAKALNDYLVLNCEYDIVNYQNDTIPAASYTATGALVNHITVCAGYARAYQALLTEAGISSYYVSGTTASNGAHACCSTRRKFRRYGL